MCKRLCNARLPITTISAFSGVNEGRAANNQPIRFYFRTYLVERFFEPYDFMGCFMKENASSATNTIGLFFGSPEVTPNESLEAGKNLGFGIWKISTIV